MASLGFTPTYTWAELLLNSKHCQPFSSLLLLQARQPCYQKFFCVDGALMAAFWKKSGERRICFTGNRRRCMGEPMWCQLWTGQWESSSAEASVRETAHSVSQRWVTNPVMVICNSQIGDLPLQSAETHRMIGCGSPCVVAVVSTAEVVLVGDDLILEIVGSTCTIILFPFLLAGGIRCPWDAAERAFYSLSYL